METIASIDTVGIHFYHNMDLYFLHPACFYFSALYGVDGLCYGSSTKHPDTLFDISAEAIDLSI